jgi:hypothetical protein
MSVRGVKARNRVSARFAFRFLGMVLLLFVPISSRATGQQTDTEANTFRWAHSTSDPQLWEQILTSFNDELAPDEPHQGTSELDIYRYKYLQKVGVLNHSALVIVGHRPAKAVTTENEWDEYYSAFNLDLATLKKSPIEHAEVMWKWKFIKLAIFGPSPVPDVTFTYLTCTECEPYVMFASLYFDAATSSWQVRSWGDGKDLWWTSSQGLVADMDVNNGGDTFSYECVYGILDLNGNGFQSVIIRCKEITLNEAGRAKIQDATVLYGLYGGQFKPQRITDPSDALGLTAKVCKPTIKSWLCRLSGYMTETSGQNEALDSMFPKARAASRDFAHFRSIKRSMSMTDVVRQCGVPDELGGSGIAIFIYHLDDGSIMAIGATDTTGPLLYANHIASSGKSTALFPTE